MNTIVEHFNLAASAFVKVALPMLAQSSVLIAVLLLVDLLVRRRVRAVFRYWMWMLVVIQLLSPPVLLLRGAVGNLSGDKSGFVGAAQIASIIDVGVTSQLIDSPEQLVTGTPEGINNVPSRTSPTITWEGAIFLVWLIVVAIMGLLLLRQVFAVGKLVCCAKQANWIMNDSLEYCCKCVGVKRKVR